MVYVTSFPLAGVLFETNFLISPFAVKDFMVSLASTAPPGTFSAVALTMLVNSPASTPLVVVAVYVYSILVLRSAIDNSLI